MAELTTTERTDIALVLKEAQRCRGQAKAVRISHGASIGEVNAQDLERRAKAMERTLEKAYPDGWAEPPEAS